MKDFFCKFFKGRQRAQNLFLADTVGEAEMSFSGKGRTWNQQDVIFFCKFAESLIITIRYFREEVECTLWFDTFKSQFSEVLI